MHRSALTLTLTSLAVLSCSGTDGAPTTAATLPAVAPPSSAFAREDVERDLTLTTRPKTDDPFGADVAPEMDVTLTNRSRDRTYVVVQSSDGSDAGWREPHTYFTVERRVAGRWERAPEEPLGRCGLYDSDWAKDARTLGPGESLTLEWFTLLPIYDLAGADRVRVTAHYDYGAHARDLTKVPPALHAMPSYALASRPVEIAVDPSRHVDRRGDPLLEP